MSRCLLLTSAWIVFAAGGALAQPAAFPASPPPDLRARPYAPPGSQVRTLPNGLTVVLSPTRTIPIVTLALGMPAGAIYEPDGQAGLAAATARQMTSGTSKYTSLQLVNAVEDLGGRLQVDAGDDFATLHASALAENSAPLVRMVAHVLLNPAFPPAELATYQSLTEQRLTVQRQDPDFLAEEQFARSLFGSHAYGIVAPTPAQVRALTRDRLRAFYRAHYTPHGSVLVVVGDFDPSKLWPTVRAAMLPWRGAAASRPAAPVPTARGAREVRLVNRPGSVQSSIALGNTAIRRASPDYYALALASVVLGGGASSRLFGNVREKLGYAYDVSAGLDARYLGGAIEEKAQTRTDVTVPAIQAMLAESGRLGAEPVGPAELTAARNLVNGQFVESLTTQSGLASRMLNQYLYHLPKDYLARFRSLITGVTAADIQRVARAYIRPEQASVVVVGDAARVREPLKAVGTVTEAR